MILDVCCNRRTWWPLGFGRHVGMDRDRSVCPDVVANFTALPFADGVFSEVWADPPHQIRSTLHPGSFQGGDMTRYGAWRRADDYANAMRDLRSEALRVLKPGGVFWLKVLVRDNPPEPRGRVPSSAWFAELLPTMSVARRRRSRVSWSRCEILLLKETA